MADLERVIEVVFNAVDNTGSAFQTVGGGLDAVATNAQKVTGPLAAVADTVITAELAAAGLGTVLLGLAYNESVAFEDALLDLQKVLSDSEGEVDQYIPRIDQLAAVYGVASTNVAEAAAEFKQSGFSINEALDLTDLSLQAVKISELEANEASELFIATLRGFGVEADQAGRLLDVLNGISNEYAASVSELGIGMADLSPIAQAAGLSFEETAGLLTPIIEIFGSGSEAATSMKTALLRLGSDTGSVVDALDALGVSQTDANGALLQSGDILAAVAEVWPTLTDAQQSYYAAELAGINQAPQLQAVLGNYETVLAATGTAFDSAGSAAAEWQVRMDAGREVLDRAVVSIENLLRAIGDQFRTEMTGAVGATTDLSSAFADMINQGGLEPLFDQLRPVLIAVTDDLTAIAAALPQAFSGLDLDPITAGFEAIGEAVSGLFDDVDLTTAEGLEQVLQGLVDIGGGFLQVTAGMIESLEPVVDFLGEMGREFGELSPEIQNSAGEFLGLISIVDGLLPAVSSIGDGLNTVGLSIAALAAANSLPALTGLFGSLTTSVSSLIPLLGTAGLAGAVGVAGYAIADWIDLNDKLVPGEDTLGTALYDLVNPADDVADAVANGSVSMADFADAAADASDVAADIELPTDQFEDAAKAQEGYADAVGFTAAELEEATEGTETFVGAVQDQADATYDATAATEEQSDTMAGYRVVIDETTGAIIGYEQVSKGMVESEKEKQSAVQDSTAALLDYEAKLAEIAGNKEIATIEAAVALDIAQLEADAKIVVATFESLDTTIESTGDLLSDLFGYLLEADTFSQKWLLEEVIEAELQARQEALENQKQLTEATIAELEAKTEAYLSGDALIKIEASELYEETEAFMWAMLQKIRIRASAEGADFLLGLSG